MKINNEWKGILKGLVVGAVLMVSATAIAAWSEPSSAPTGGNADAPINVSNTSQIKGGNLVVNSNNQSANGLIVPFGNVLVKDKICNNSGTKCFTVENLCQQVRSLCQ
ncbi:MAG TPA: hypothetical protein VJK09_00245 [Candidatus Paceibacterota bacterium]